MHAFNVTNFHHFSYMQLPRMLLKQPLVDVGEWQGKKVEDEDHLFLELNDVTFEMQIPLPRNMATVIEPNLPWAEDHFQERVAGKPLNPPPSAENWPFAQNNNEEHKKGKVFSHTYPERFWPKFAGINSYHARRGIRFPYGDLSDVVVQLSRNPLTRQAYLPVWFPEDTGAVEGQRVPCTLGYHFQIRDFSLNVTYMIRSCDLLRHFRDDVYMACRLGQWMIDTLNSMMNDHPMIHAGNLTMHIMNLHVFAGDHWRLKQMVNSYEDEEEMGVGV